MIQRLKYIKLCISILLFMHQNTIVYAQQSILLNQSAYNLFTLNPAALGLNLNYNINAHYKKNWLGMSESPEALCFTIDRQINAKKIGWGLNILNEKAGIFSATNISLATNYKLKIKSNHALYFGISFGMKKIQSNFSKIIADRQDEFAFWPQQQSVTQPDASFGLIYTTNKLVLGVSANQILKNSFGFNEAVYNSSVNYNTLPYFIFVAKYSLDIKKEVWQFVPQLCIRTPQGISAGLDATSTFIYKQKLYLGIGYRGKYALYGNWGFAVSENFRLMYSYEYAMGIQNYTRGGHEIGLNYTLSSFSAGKKKTIVESEDETVSQVYMEMDLQKQNINSLNSKIDSLDKNLKSLKDQLNLLKEQQLNYDEIERFHSRENETKPSHKTHKHELNAYVLNPTYAIKNVDYESEDKKNNFQIVLGVYQLLNYAKEFQKLLKRELNFETTLVQVSNHPKNYLYVCLKDNYTALNEALKRLDEVKIITQKQSLEITNGNLWILQTTQN